MKHINLLPVFMSAVVLLAACKINGGKEVKATGGSQDSGQHELSHIAQQTPETASINDDILNAIYTHYIHLNTALIKGDVAASKVASIAIEAGARQVPGGGSLANSAARITTASDINAQRAAYSILSNEMIAKVQQSGMKQGEIYIDYCPMALDNKGAYWLSSGKGIENPYFGDEMLTCGEVKDTIK